MSVRTKLVVCAVSIAWLSALGCGQSARRPSAEPAAARDDPAKAPDQAAAPSDAAASQAEAPCWPRFHGPGGDNISTDAGLLKEWPDDGPELLWTAKGIGEGYSGITTADGRIYTDGNLDGRTTITALNLDGSVAWQAQNGAAWTGEYEGTRGTPTIDGPRLYHLSPVGRLACLETATGKEVWARNVLDEFAAKNIKWALAESVLVDGDRVVCTPGGPQVSMVALDKTSGQTVWKAASTGNPAGYGSATLAECQGLRMIVNLDAKGVFGVSADTGELLWKWKHETSYDVNVLKPICHDGHVFISSGYGAGSELLKLTLSGGKVTVERAWASKELDNHHGGVILLDGYLYGAASNANAAKWICLDWQTGKMMYADKGVGKGSLTSADGLLYTLSEKRAVGLVEPTPDQHKLISRFQIPAGGKGNSWAHPVVIGGRLYIRHGDFLYAYDVRKP
jgi:outer membrane protein assembly factor BamB